MAKSNLFLYLCLSIIIIISTASFLGSFDQDLSKISQLYDKTAEIQGVIVNEVEQRIDQQKFELELKSINSKILVTTELYPKYQFGDELSIAGTLREPAVFDDFDYKQYLAKDDIHLAIYYPKIDKAGENQANLFYKYIFRFKTKMRQIIEQTLLPPYSAIVRAVFLGDRHGISDKLKEKLNITGTRHIVAISGMHMIIMVQILMYLALAIGLWRGQAFYLVIFILILYIMLIGAPASAVRAGIMAGLLLLAQKIGRLRSAGRAIVFAATIMLIFNPLLIKSDVGFQLSFVATLSIVYLKPVFDKLIKKAPDFWRLKDILTMTLAAQLGTLPLIIYHFGRVSWVSSIANILIVPVLPVIMMSAMILVGVGLIYLPAAKIFAGVVWLVLAYLVQVVEWLARVG